MGRGLLKETTMRTRHLFTSAAIAAVLAVALPVHAQILGGGAQGGLGGTLGGTLGGGAGGMRGPMNDGVGGSMHGGGRGSAHGGVGGELDGLGGADRLGPRAQDGTRASARALGKGEASADKAQGSARHDVRACAIASAAKAKELSVRAGPSAGTDRKMFQAALIWPDIACCWPITDVSPF